MHPQDAWADESFAESDDGKGVYVVAAALFEGELNHVRHVMRGIRTRQHQDKLHWSKMDPAERRKAAEQVAAIGGLNIVAIASPVPRRRQERARAACLGALVPELHGYEVTRLYVESRGQVLDRRDVDVVRACRWSAPASPPLRLEHRRGAAEPLLWVADIVAGACRSHRQGREPEYREALGDLVYDIEVDSGC
ncbi:hypothetical protein SAMN05421678_108222 [Actinopolymorpha cephalotaxi]|uniref:DUF3800 domain-containing protein n=1 Tax=Actinopolymorpha cephalotaxi TaxID=504797 RepID=A0A1I2UKM5_9ACTN|nr:hypothetical protein [Actinopolymorpha cephalotaxi]NYH86636.1 hypothetical protein [Actinopolymorpha cephalotaxi]SFG77695.1 hypothetical protein SAMN05421678_108222 [Actinopolymorpha cephalotaxi]